MVELDGMSEIDIVIDKEYIDGFVKLSIEDYRNVYKITTLGSEKFRVNVKARKLSLLERYRMWRLDKRRYKEREDGI